MAESVLLVTTGLGQAGAERQLVYLALGLRARGWDVAVAILTPLVHPEFERRLSSAGIPLTILQSTRKASLSSLWRAMRAALALVRETKPTILVGFLAHGALIVRAVGRIARVPRVVVSLRSIHSRRRWHDWLLALTRGLDDVVVTNSRPAARAQIADGVTTAAKSVVIANGFDPTRVSGAAAPREAGAPFRWLCIAGFRPEKGHSTLLAAARSLLGKRPFTLLLAGEGPGFDATRAEAARLGLCDIAIFLGNQDDVGSLIASADAFVLPSLQEGLPNALIEALAGGLPAISSDVGSCSELIESGVSGWLVPPGDPDKLAAAMMRVMDLPDEIRQRMGAAGRQHILSGFSVESMVERWEQVLSRGG